MSALVEATDISVSFGDTPVLETVSLAVNAGEAVGVVGPNGAGKTTLLKVLTGVLTPDAGHVTVQGDRLETLSRRDVARRMAVVPQTTPQVFDYSVLEFVLMGGFARSREFVPSGRQLQQATAALEEMAISDLATRPVSRVSGGELQRALLAQAMVADAPLWLLDEPTASLDVRHRSRVLRTVRRHTDGGAGAIAVLHDLELVHRFFDRVIALADRRIRVDGPPDEVLTPEVVSEMYGVSMRRGLVDGQVVWIEAE